SDSGADVAGEGASPSVGGDPNGDAGHNSNLAGANYLTVENDPDCPAQDEDWSRLDGKACDERLVLDCYKVWDCKPDDAHYVDQTLYCFDATWTLSKHSGSCDSSSVRLDPTSGCPTTPWSAAQGLPCPKE